MLNKNKTERIMFADESTPTQDDVAFLQALDVSVKDSTLPLFNAYTSVVKHIVETDPHSADLNELDELLSAVDFVPSADRKKTSLAAQKMCESFGDHMEELTSIDKGPDQFIKVSVLGYAARALEQLSQGEFEEARRTMWQARERVLCTQLRDKLNVEWQQEQLKQAPKKAPKKAQKQAPKQSPDQNAIVVRLSGGPNRAKFAGFKNKHEVEAWLKNVNTTGKELVFSKSSVAAVHFVVFPNDAAGPSKTAAKSGHGNAVAMSLSNFVEQVLGVEKM